MSYYRFRNNDVFINALRTNPASGFLIYSGSVYYRNTPYESGSIFLGNATHVPVGAISLYELNVDREESAHTYDYENNTGVKTMIHPFIVKSGDNLKFKTISTGSYNVEDYGTSMTASFNYPVSASLSRELYPENHLANAENYSARHNLQLSPQTYNAYNTEKKNFDSGLVTVSSSYIEALRNTLDFYTPLSDHYAFTSSAKVSDDSPQWDKGVQSINMINIPSIYYGKSIKKGSVNLKFYISGTIASEVTDIYENGTLVEVSGTYSGFSTGSVAGVVLYNEGIVLLTGSWDISSGHTEPYSGDSASPVAPSWLYWGVGITSSLNVPGTSQLGSIAKSNGDIDYTLSPEYNIPSSSYSMDFKGIEDVPVKTMLAHAPKGELYYSNNPTFLTANATGSLTKGIISRPGLGSESVMSGSIQKAVTGSSFYVEDSNLEIKNINSSSFPNHTASFEKITYISKIGIYDDQKNLIGIAKLARPAKKTVHRDLTFKLRLDI